MPRVAIAVEGEDTADVVEGELLKALGAVLPQSLNRTFTLAARDEKSRLIGGLSASTSYGWLLIKTLWVDSAHRKQGIGSSLVGCAEAQGLDYSCHAAWLDTSNPDSMRFYRALGYETFGELTNVPGQFPPEHHRWFLKKSLPLRT